MSSYVCSEKNNNTSFFATSYPHLIPTYCHFVPLFKYFILFLNIFVNIGIKNPKNANNNAIIFFYSIFLMKT